MDHPASQRAKQKPLKQLGAVLPDRHEFIGINFEKEGLRGGSGPIILFCGNDPAFFSWLGTVHYLTPQAVEKTLTAIAACAARF